MTNELMNIWKHVDRIGDLDLADRIEESLLNEPHGNKIHDS